MFCAQSSTCHHDQTGQEYQREERGFTLLEILLTLALASIVMSLVGMTVKSSLQTVSITAEQDGLYHRARVALQRLQEDLSGAILLGDGFFKGGEEAFTSDESTLLLQFTSTTHLRFASLNQPQGRGLITYRVVESPESTENTEENGQEMLLLRRDTLLHPGLRPDEELEEKFFVLSDRLRSVIFRFYDEEGNELESWSAKEGTPGIRPSGTTSEALPAAVRCELEYWLNQETETSLLFSGTALLPVGQWKGSGNQ